MDEANGRDLGWRLLFKADGVWLDWRAGHEACNLGAEAAVLGYLADVMGERISSMGLPPDQCERIFAGEAPLKVWREFRELAVTDLRRDTGIRVERLEKLEHGLVKPTGAEIRKLARALDITPHNLEPHHAAYRGCSALDVDEDAIIAGAEEPDDH